MLGSLPIQVERSQRQGPKFLLEQAKKSQLLSGWSAFSLMYGATVTHLRSWHWGNDGLDVSLTSSISNVYV
jgi:hypothetical protein